MNFLKKLSNFCGKYFVLLVLVVAAVAMIFPNFFLFFNKYRVFNQTLVNFGLSIIMFCMGLTVKRDEFKVVLKNPKEIFIGFVSQFTIMPLLAFFIAKSFNLHPALAVGLVLLGTSPGGQASNVMTYIAKGDVALSVGMTTVGTIMSPLLTPVLTYFLAGQWVKVDIYVMFIDITKIVLIPIFLGMLLQYFFETKIQKMADFLVLLPTLTIVFVMGLCVAPNKENLLSASLTLILAVCIHHWFGYLLGYLVGKMCGMNYKQRKTLSLEVGLQSSGLAIGLSHQFTNPLCALPAAIATVVHQLSAAVLANLFSGEIFNKNIKLKYKGVSYEE